MTWNNRKQSRDPSYEMMLAYGVDHPVYKLQQTVSAANFPLFIPEVVNEVIQTLYDPIVVGRTLCRNVTTDSPVMSWIREDGMDVQMVEEGEEPSRSRLRYEKFTMRLYKIGHTLDFTRDLIEDANLDIVGRHVARVIAGIARKEDEFIFSMMLNGVADGSTYFKTGREISSHIIDGSTSGGWTAPSGTAVLTHEKIGVAMQIGETEGIPYDTVLMHPAQKYQMLKLIEYRNPSNSYLNFLSPGGEAIMDNGGFKTSDLLGFEGLNIATSWAMDVDKALFFNKNEFCAFMERRPLTAHDLTDNLHDMIGMAFYERIGTVVTNPLAATLVQGLSYSDPTDHNV